MHPSQPRIFLRLQDEALNELLPFGEYVSPHEQAATAAMLESWELERFLVRLAAAEQRERRAARQLRTRRGGAREDASVAQPISRMAAGGAEPSGAAAGAMFSMPDRAEGSGLGGSPTGGVASSWPPSRSDGSGAISGAVSQRTDSGAGGDALSPGDAFRSASQAIKSRFAALRLRCAY